MVKNFFEGIQWLFEKILFLPHEILRDVELSSWWIANCVNFFFLFVGIIALIYWSKKLKDFEIVVPNKKQLNLSNFNKCFSYVEDNKPDILLNFAAYTNVDEAEGNSKYAYAVNAEAPKAFSMALKKHRGKFITNKYRLCF